ncbi:hypothetical protein ACWGE0_35315 [Lentzea sp. NPDC054927]
MGDRLGAQAAADLDHPAPAAGSHAGTKRWIMRTAEITLVS